MKIANVIQQAKDIASLFHLMLWKKDPIIASPSPAPAPAPVVKPRSPQLASLKDQAGHKVMQIPSATPSIMAVPGRLITPKTAAEILPNLDKCFAFQLENPTDIYIAIPVKDQSYYEIFTSDTLNKQESSGWTPELLAQRFADCQLILGFERSERLMLPSLPPKAPEPTTAQDIAGAFHLSIKEILTASLALKAKAYDPFEL